MTLPRRQFVSLLLIYCFVLASIPGVSAHNPSRVVQQNTSDKEEGLRFRLSEGADQPEVRPTTNLAPSTSLSTAETEAILKRLPPIKSETSDETDFALRPQSLPPPRTGVTVMQPFPVTNEAVRPTSPTTSPLEVIRYSPEGDVPVAPSLSITFSQPMIAITSQEEAAKDVPVKLEPEPPGKWRWIGTKTLLFEPDVRFPMATQFSIRVPAGTRSANGGTLSNEKAWTFTTPAPTVKTTYPGADTPQRLDTVMFVELDQRIDPAVVLKTIKATAGKTQLTLRLATTQEIEADQSVKDLVKNAEKGRWLAFRAIDALPGESRITVTIGPGTPSMEGPRKTKDEQEFNFSTFGPLKVVKSECGYNNRCNPNDYWRVDFNNPIDDAAFRQTPGADSTCNRRTEPHYRRPGSVHLWI